MPGSSGSAGGDIRRLDPTMLRVPPELRPTAWKGCVPGSFAAFAVYFLSRRSLGPQDIPRHGDNVVERLLPHFALDPPRMSGIRSEQTDRGRVITRRTFWRSVAVVARSGQASFIVPTTWTRTKLCSRARIGVGIWMSGPTNDRALWISPGGSPLITRALQSTAISSPRDPPS